MGITGELVRSVFSRNRSFATRESTARSNAIEKRKWSLVRSYLCGDEFNSVLAEKDSASIHSSSEATVTQPLPEDLPEKRHIQSEEDTKEQNHNPMSKLFHEEDAAIIIQSTFRKFLARRCQNEEIQLERNRQEVESPSKESMGTSIEVQTGNSVEAFSLQEDSMGVSRRLQQKPRTPILKTKEDWDDSTVSSNIAKMRIQNRLEATTRRERALAYAFSQQLRICSKKKQTRSDSGELNIGWNWLERWMATRVPESCSIEDHAVANQIELFHNSTMKFTARRRSSDVAGEEKESCGSNEVSVQFDSFSVTTAKEIDSFQPTKNRHKARKNVSRRKTVPSNQCPKGCSKANKKGSSKEGNRRKNKQNQTGSKKEIKCQDAYS